MLDNIYTEKITVTEAQASAGIDIECGFKPKLVRIFNATAGKFIEWMDTLDDDDYIQVMDTDTDTDTAEGSTPDPAADGVKLVTSGGITPSSGTTSEAPGFSIAAGLCTEDEVLHVFAIR